MWQAIDLETKNEMITVDDPMWKMKELFDQTVIVLGQAMNTCAYTRRFNILMEFFGDKLKVENLLRNSRASNAEDNNDCLLGQKYEEFMTKSLNLKSKSKEVLVTATRESHRGGRPFRKGPLPFKGGRGRNLFSSSAQNFAYRPTQYTRGQDKNKLLFCRNKGKN